MSGSRSVRRHNLLAGSLAAILVCGGGAVLTAAPASARPLCDMPTQKYTITSAGSVWKATNLSSSYVRGRGSVSLAKGRAYTVSASMTATVSAEASAIFAKASASLGITVGASYTGSQAFTYTLEVPKGKVRRMQQYKSARKFTVRKYSLNNANCTYNLRYTSSVIAPVKSKAEKYFLYKLVS